MQATLESIHAAYVLATKRTANYQVHERGLYEFQKVGFTAEDMSVVCDFLMRENRRNEFQYSLQLSKLLNDLARFDDLLQEARAKFRNRIKPATEREKVLNQFSPVVNGDSVTATGAMSVKEIMAKVIS